MQEKKLCKHCKSEMNKKAKVCPTCHRSQSSKLLKLLIIIVIIFGCIFACTSACTKGVSDAIDEAEKEKNEEKKNFSYEITKQYTDSLGLMYYIEGTVKNSNNKSFFYVSIEFVCYDKDNNNLGTAIDSTTNLGANEIWKFKAGIYPSGNPVDHCNFKEITNW